MGTKRIMVKSGGTTLDISPEMLSMTEELVNKLLPDTRRKLEEEITRIEDEARSKWLVREKNSKNSKGKIYAEVAVTPNFELVGNIGNKAEYAWAIKVGKDPQNSGLQEKKRLSNELLWKPVRKNTNNFAQSLADEITKQLEK